MGFEGGYHRTYISLMERGMKSPSLGTIMNLSSALGVSASEIMARIESDIGKVKRSR